MKIQRFEKYRCPKCKSNLNYNIKFLICNNCDEKFLIENNIPIFSNEMPSKEKGIYSKLFNKPKIYDFFIKTKLLFYNDKHIGLNELVKNKTFLNVGCGSNVDMENYLEYNHKHLKELYSCDLSKSFIFEASKNYTDINKSKFSVCSVDKLPFDDNSFDIVFISFVLHHVPMSISNCIKELNRVAKKYIVVYDHIKEENFFWKKIQEFYWDKFDGGLQYNTEYEWEKILSSYNIIKSIRTGIIGKHVFKFIIEKKN